MPKSMAAMLSGVVIFLNVLVSFLDFSGHEEMPIAFILEAAMTRRFMTTPSIGRAMGDDHLASKIQDVQTILTDVCKSLEARDQDIRRLDE